MGEKYNLAVLKNQRVGDFYRPDAVTAKTDFILTQRRVKPQLPPKATDVGDQT